MFIGDVAVEGVNRRITDEAEFVNLIIGFDTEAIDNIYNVIRRE